MGNECCIGEKEHGEKEHVLNAQVDCKDEIFNAEILSFIRNMDEQADEPTRKPGLKHSEKRGPTRKPLLKQLEKPITRFFKKAAIYCCSNPHAPSIRVALPLAPSVYGVETDAASVVNVMCDVVPPTRIRSDLSGSYILDTTSGEMGTFLMKLSADGLITYLLRVLCVLYVFVRSLCFLQPFPRSFPGYFQHNAMGSIGEREHVSNAQVDYKAEIFNEEILSFVRNMNEQADEHTRKPGLKHSEKREPMKKPLLKQSEKPVTRFVKKAAVYCCGNPHAQSVRVALPSTPHLW